jgi:hypothetical protein
MSSFAQQVSQKKAVKSALERIDQLEQDLPKIVMGVNEAVMGQRRGLGELASVVEALTEILGAGTVDAKIKEINERKVQAQLDKAKAALDEGLAKGDLVKADAVSDKSLIVGREYDKDGNVLPPGRAQITFDGIMPEFQDKLLGQGPGFTVETKNGGKFEVVEVYDVLATPVTAESADGNVESAPVEA